jgi:hypothetical protein
MHPSRTFLFRLAALAILCTAIYHGIAFFYPPIVKAVYGAGYLPGYPPRRHLAWVAIFVILAWLLLWRPTWLLLPYTVMVVQQFNGHGRNIWKLWTHSGLISWAEVGLLTGYIVIGLLLIVDLRERRARLGQAVTTC